MTAWTRKSGSHPACCAKAGIETMVGPDRSETWKLPGRGEINLVAGVRLAKTGKHSWLFSSSSRGEMFAEDCKGYSESRQLHMCVLPGC